MEKKKLTIVNRLMLFVVAFLVMLRRFYIVTTVTFSYDVSDSRKCPVRSQSLSLLHSWYRYPEAFCPGPIE